MICTSCGRQVAGNYCSNCGTPVWNHQQGIYDTVLKGSAVAEHLGFVATLGRIAASPVAATLRIAATPDFSHRGFLGKCIAAYAAIGVLSKVQLTDSIAAAFFSTGGLLVAILVQTVLTYWGLRLFAGSSRSGGAYASLICIAQGVAMLFLGASEFLGFAFGLEIYAVAMLLQAIILAPYWALVLGRFWGLHPAAAYGVYLASMVPAMLLLIPVLGSFQDAFVLNDLE